MNLEARELFIFSRTLALPSRPIGTSEIFLGLSVALAVVSCTTLEPRNPPAIASAVNPAPARQPVSRHRSFPCWKPSLCRAEGAD